MTTRLASVCFYCGTPIFESKPLPDDMLYVAREDEAYAILFNDERAHVRCLPRQKEEAGSNSPG